MDHKHPSPVASPQASGCFASPTVVGNFLDFMLPKAQSTAIKSVNQKSSSPLCGAATYTVITNQSLSVHGKDLSVQRLSSPAASGGDESMQLLNLENLSACLLEYSTSSGAVEDQQLQQKLANSIPPEASADHGGNGKGISLEEQEAVEHAVHLNDEELRHLEEAFEDFSQDTTAATCQPPSSKNVQSADTCGLLRSPPSVATPVFDSPDATMASSIPSLNESSSSKQSVVDAETRCCVLSEINANVPNSPSCPKSYKENQPSLPTTAKFLSEEEEDRENQPPNTTSSKPVRIPEAQEDSFSPNLSDPIYRRQLSTILECQSKESLLAVKSSSSNPPDASETVQRSAVFNNDFPDANTTSSSLPTEALAPADLPLLSLPRTPRLPRGVISAARLAYWPVSPPSAEDLQVNLSAPEVLIVSPSAALPLTTQVTVSCRRPLGEITLDGLAVHVSLKPAEAHFNLPIRLPSALQPDSLCLLPSRLSTPLTFHAQLAIESDGASTVPKEGFACDLLVTAHVYSTAKPVRSLSSTSKCVRLRCEGLQKVNRAGDIEETETVTTASVCTEDEMPAAPPEDNDSTADPEPSAATPHYSDLSPPGVASAPVTPEVGVIADDSSAARMEEPSTDEAPIRAVDKNPRLLSSSQPPPSLGKRSDTTASLFATTKCLFWPASSYDSSRSQYLILKHKFPGVVRIRLEITSGSDVFMLLNDRGLPSKGGRLIELPAELQCTIGVVYSPLPGQQWHFGELQLRVDTPSRVHSKVRLIGYAESSKIDIYCCKRVDENTFWSVAFPCHPPRMDLPSPGDHRSSGSVIATEPAWVTRVVVSNWGQRTAWVLVRYSPWKEETVKSTAAAATDVTTELQAPRLTVKPDRFFLAPNQIVDVHITITGEPIVARVLFYHGNEVIRQQFCESYRSDAGRKRCSDASRADTSGSRLHTFDLIDIATGEGEKENSFLTAEVSTAPIASVRPELWRQWLHTELKETPPLTLMVRCVESPKQSNSTEVFGMSQPSPQTRPTSSPSVGYTSPVSTLSTGLRQLDRCRPSSATNVNSAAAQTLSRSESPPATAAVLPLKPLGRPHVPVLLRIIGSPATFTKSDSSCKVSLLNLSHVNPLVIRLGQLVSPFFLIKPSARKFKLRYV
uniref:Centrosomal protein of 192 kDa n=1 Tax=Schistocephalus solidus TaxID=70667 RepID=A0A0X3PHG9_SCHSO